MFMINYENSQTMYSCSKYQKYHENTRQRELHKRVIMHPEPVFAQK